MRSPLPACRILVVDDDEYFADFLVHMLVDRGEFRDVVQAHTPADALAQFDAAAFDLVILDIKMHPDGAFRPLETAAGFKTGIALARELRRRDPTVKIIGYTGALDPEAEDWFKTTGAGAFLYKTHNPVPLLREAQRLLSERPRPPKAFIVHGRDRALALELKDFLQNRLGFDEPLILRDLPSGGRTIIEKFEHYAEQADLAFVLMTPDDIGHLNGVFDAQARPRMNVVFEYGFFIGRLSRTSGRVLLLHAGQMELPSDVLGIVSVDVSDGIERAGEDLRRQLKHWL